MPRVKLEHVVSFSSEQPEGPASNLLAWEVNKKRWLCGKGEPSGSVVLQLAKSVKIASIHIGVYHAALVEVLVGRSEKPSEPFQVLVPSCVFLSPSESRRDVPVERVRSFSEAQLTSLRDQGWDRLRVVCSQPYNKHCKYGLSFVHVFEPEDKKTTSKTEPATSCSETATAVPTRLNLDTYSSDDDDFKPGELFAKHNKSSDSSDSQPSTDAQIRRATSQALKNIFGSSTKLVKTPISKPSAKKRDPTDEDRASDRRRDSLFYTDDDDKPHAKIDHIVQTHKHVKNKEQETTKHATTDEKYDKKNKNTSKEEDKQNKDVKKDFRDSKGDDRPKIKTPQSSVRDARHSSDRKKRESHSSRDRGESGRAKIKSHSDNKHSDIGRPRPGLVSSAPHTLLSGVVLALSGYANPRRAAVRDAALAMGARYVRDWTPACTHLICAFPNTPKLQAVRSSPAGNACAVATAEWVERCCATRRLLPWQWFATEPSRRIKPTPEELALLDADGDQAKPAGSECDTDDEIEKVLKKQKKRKRDRSPSAEPPAVKGKSPSPTRLAPESANVSGDSVEFVCDERIKDNVTIEDSAGDTTDEEPASVAPPLHIAESEALPDLFDGCTFVVDASAERAGFDSALLRRYITAYGGLLLDESQLDDDTAVDYVLCGESVTTARRGARALRADWLWRCQRERRLAAASSYELPLRA